MTGKSITSQGDRKGRPYHDDELIPQRIMVGATLAVALAWGRVRSSHYPPQLFGRIHIHKRAQLWINKPQLRFFNIVNVCIC